MLTLALPAAAQYTGRTTNDQQKKAAVEPRAISVLEWIGEPGKPVASRIVPVAVWVNGGYQDGGLYLAKPEPLTVQTDTLYELEKAGVPQGTFYIAGGQDVAGAWFGYGQWKPLGAPKPVKKLQPSKVPPTVVEDHDPDRPRFKGGDPKSSGDSSTTASSSTPSSSGSTAGPTSSSDPDQPSLHRRADSSDGGSGSSSTSAGGSGGTAPSGSGSGTNTSSTGSTDNNDPDKPTLHRRDPTVSDTGAGTAPDDPDRPHLTKHSDATKTASGSSDPGSPVSSVNEADPDRPKMSRGKPTNAEKALDASKLNGLPAELQQMAAVSDPAVREQHAFTYPWPDPSEAAKMQTAVEALAIKAILVNGAPVVNTPAKAPAPKQTGPRSTLARQVAPKALPVVLQDKDFRAYELAYSGGATMVFTARALVGPNNAGVTSEKYVTIIAQPDFDGVPQIRLQSVTDAKHLDITPRMRLVDAVDTRGDNQADLLFELRRATDRQFAIYHVRGSHAEQAFATESLPTGTPNHAETDSN